MLAPNGILALNFVAFANDKSTALSSVSRTIEQAFPNQSVFIAEPGEDYNDFIFLASAEAIDLNSKSLSPEEMSWLQTRLYSVNKTQGIILTDNFNPLEHMQVEKSERYRRELISWFGTDLFVR